MKQKEILVQIQKIDKEINTPISFLIQSPLFNTTELNAVRFFTLNLLQAKMNKELKKERKGVIYKNSFNTRLVNTKY